MKRVGIATAAVLLFLSGTVSPERMLSEADGLWDETDFAAGAPATHPERTEALFDRYVRLLEDARLMPQQSGPHLQNLLDRAETDQAVFRLFAELCEKYLYSPESPVRSDELYLFALERIIESPHLNDYEKLRPRSQRNMALRNRPGERAADFVCTLADGTRKPLHGIEAEFTLLFFNDPDCGECEKMIRALQQEPLIRETEKAGRLRVVAVYSSPEERYERWRSHLDRYPAGWIAACDEGARIHYEGLYDLRIIPCLYLLDARKRVLTKGAVSVERIAADLHTAIR